MYRIANGSEGAYESFTVGKADDVGFELDRLQASGKKKNPSQAQYSPSFQGSSVKMPTGRDGTLKVTLFAAKDSHAVSIDLPIHLQISKRGGGEAMFSRGDARWYADCFLMNICYGLKTEDFAAPGHAQRADYSDRSSRSTADPNAEEAALMIRLAALRVMEKIGNDPSVLREDVNVPAGTFSKAIKFRVDLRLDSTVRQATVWAHSAVPVTGAVKIDTGGLALELLDANSGT